MDLNYTISYEQLYQDSETLSCQTKSILTVNVASLQKRFVLYDLYFMIYCNVGDLFWYSFVQNLI